MQRTVRRPDQIVLARLRVASASWVFHLFLSLIIITVVFTHPPAVFYGDTDTARNYLNTIVSSLSTILALCISIILVAIQMTASNYTHRVLDFFVRLPYNASLFAFYLVTIMYSFVLMAQIRDPVNEPVPARLRPEMSADLVLVVICFVSLLMYMYAVMQLLKPDRIIALILREYERAVARGSWTAAVESIEQICDIAKRAASVSDSVTGADCIEAMGHIVAGLPVPATAEDPLLQVHRNVVEQWVEIVGVAVKEKESGLLYGAIDALHTQGRHYIERHAWPAAELVIQAYRQLVFGHLLSEGQGYYAQRVAERLYKLARCAVGEGERGRTFCLRTWRTIQVIGENAFAAQPVGVTLLLDGFLMCNELQPTFERLRGHADQTACVVCYFELWKAYVALATVRDTARWARWWNEAMIDDGMREMGRTLATLLALHSKRMDVAQTLSYVWAVTLQETAVTRLAQALGPRQQTLFDGWPWRALVEQVKAVPDPAAP